MCGLVLLVMFVMEGREIRESNKEYFVSDIS